MINVADRRITERIPAAPITKHDQLSEEPVETAAERITTGQWPTLRCGVQPAPPQPTLAGGHNVAGNIGWQWPIAIQLGWAVIVGISRVSSGIMICTSALTSGALVCPVIRSTSVSAMFDCTLTGRPPDSPPSSLANRRSPAAQLRRRAPAVGGAGCHSAVIWSRHADHRSPSPHRCGRAATSSRRCLARRVDPRQEAHGVWGQPQATRRFFRSVRPRCT